MDYSVRPDDFTDAGNAQVYRQYYKGLLVYSDALGWLNWTGKRWERGEHRAYTRAEALTLEMMEEALLDRADARRRESMAVCALSQGQEDARELLKEARRDFSAAQAYLEHAKRTRQSARLWAMVEMARHDMVVRADTLDADPFLLNTPAGEIDLRTGTLTEHGIDSPFHYCTHITAAAPAHTMEGTSLWYNFLNTVVCGDAALAMFLQRAVGMALVGRVLHEGVLLACGDGRNGKSTFFNALAAVLGDYAGSLDADVLTCDRQRRGAALATLRGRRLVLAAELERNQRLSTAALKQLASTDRMVIEEKYKAPETVEPTHTLVLFTNYLPRVSGADQGTWRRLLVVPFNARIDPAADVPNYARVLADKAGGDILSWAVDGARLFLEEGGKLTPPPAVAEATEAYRAREDWLGRFLAQRCRQEPNARTGARELYLAYRQWAEECGEYVRSEKTFAEGMKGRGIAQIAPKNKRVWLDVSLEATG